MKNEKFKIEISDTTLRIYPNNTIEGSITCTVNISKEDSEYIKKNCNVEKTNTGCYTILSIKNVNDEY